MNIFGEKLLGAIDKAISEPAKDSAKLIAAEIMKSGPPIINDGDRAKLRDLQTEWKAAFQAANHEFSEAEAKKTYSKQLAEHAKHSRSAGKLGTVRTRSLESLIGEYEGKRQAAKQEMRQISAEAWAITKPIITRFIAIAEPFTARVKQEAEEAISRLTTAQHVVASEKNALDTTVPWAPPAEQIRFLDL